MPAVAAVTPPTVSEREIIRRARAGDEAAFELLVNQYSRRILDYCRRMVNDALTAEDLAQETFVKFYLSLENFDETKPVSPFLYRIEHNRCIDWLRKKKVPTVSLAVEDNEDDRAHELDVADDTSAPDALAARAEVQQAIDDALASLPPAYRSSLILRYREGLSYDEIAAALKLPVGTVKAHIHRGRQRLQQKLASYV